MEAKANAVSFFDYVAFFLLCVGLLLDVFTIIWAYQAAHDKGYKSGNFLIPAILYIVSIIMIDININKTLFITIFVLMHLFIYFILGIIFEKIWGHYS